MHVNLLLEEDLKMTNRQLTNAASNPTLSPYFLGETYISDPWMSMERTYLGNELGIAWPNLGSEEYI